MKVVLPVDESNFETSVCPSFGRAPYFMVYDSDKKDTTFLANKAAGASGGAGIKAAQEVVDQKAGVLLTVRCGQNAAEVLTSSGIKIYKTTVGKAKDNIRFFERGELSLMTEFHEGFHGKH